LKEGNVLHTIHLPSLPKVCPTKPETPEGATFFRSSKRTARSKLLFMLPVEKTPETILQNNKTKMIILTVWGMINIRHTGTVCVTTYVYNKTGCYSR
jgi:hypothetical protein